MNLKKLRLFQFRNFANQEIDLRPGLCFFVGRNGQGKTNLLEAVHLLSRGESFRPAQHEHFIKINSATAHSSSLSDTAQRARITARLETESLQEFQLTHNLCLDFVDGRRSLTLDGKRTGFSTMASLFPVVLFSPESLAAIKEGPDQRRQLIDNVLITRSEKDSRLLKEFQKTLRSRNALLKQIAEGDRRTSTLGTLESITKLFLLLATQVTEARIQALRALEGGFRESAAQIFSGASLLETPETSQCPHDFSFVYEISGQDAIGWGADQIFDAISQRHRELEHREMDFGASLIGPQKHDFRIQMDQNDSRYYGSQGQQRALILAFKIAQINLHQKTLGRYPVLLLDDVMSELDSDKRGRLMEYLEQTRAQVLITATDLTWSSRFSHERNAVFTVENGIVTLATSSAVRAVGPANMLEDAST